jgi:cell wall-associated NlpC family hydrolase
LTGQDIDMSNAATGWRGDVLSMARGFLGTPYAWGGATPQGFDCSGLIQYIYAKQGINMPRLSADQARAGKRVDLSQLRPGDLVAWDNSSRNNGADHIAIYIGNNRIIHAPRPGASVEVSEIFDRGNAWGVAIR